MSEVYGAAIKVSADSLGPAKIIHAESKSVSESFSFSGGGSVKGTIKDLVKGQAQGSFTWTKAFVTSTTLSGSYDVTAGRTGYLSFRPKMNQVKGTLRTVMRYAGKVQSDTTSTVIARSPVKLSNGIADGIYQVVYR